MKTFKLSFLFDGWDICQREVKAKALKDAKAKLRKLCKGKATSITAC